MQTDTNRPTPRPDVAEDPSERKPADAVMAEYVGYLAGWFDIAQLAVGRRLNRGGMSAPLLNDP